MNTWLEALKSQPRQNTTAAAAAKKGTQRERKKYPNRRQRNRLAGVTTGGNVASSRSNGSDSYDTVGYTQLNQGDAELGAPKPNNDDTSHSGSGSDSESSIEDLFLGAQARQVRRKMVRKGTYSMRNTFETSREYAPATHTYFQHYKQQQQHQQPPLAPCVLHLAPPPNLQQQQLQQQQLQQQQQLHQHQHHNNSSKWLPYTSSSSQQQQQQQLDDANWQHSQSKHSNGGPAAAASSSSSAVAASASRTYITPSDIPPPPPHPTSLGGSKRFQAAHRVGSRCQCDHPIELKQPPAGGYPSCAANHKHHANHMAALPPPPGHQPTQQQQQQQHRPHNCSHQHLPPAAPREHLLPAPFQEGLQRKPDQLLAASSKAANQQQRNYPPQQHYHHSQQQQPQQHKKQNLVYSQAKIRKLRIILGVIGGVVIAVLLATALYFIIRGDDTAAELPQSTDNGIHLDDILTGQLVARRFNGSWSTGSNVIYKEGNSIVEYDAKAKTKATLYVDDKQQYALHDKSADGQILLLAKNYKKNFRHSFEAEYDLLNISSGELQPLKIKGDQKSIIMVQWAPVGNGLILNFERNLYYKPSAFADEIAITSDDNPAILNGIPDWVYEEEVFSSNTATWFNPNGSQIAFIKFDDSPTHVINFPYYGEAGDLRYQYPFNRLVAYPKAGSSNPIVKLYTADLVRAAQGVDFLTEIIRPSALNTETDYLITVVSWLNNDDVLSVWMNRVQNLAYLQVSDERKRYEIYNMEAKNGWVDLFSAPFKNRDGSRVALILPQLQDDDTYYRQLCTIATGASNASPEALTKGKYVVQSILHWDTDSNIIFYTANTEQNSEVLHVYAIRGATGQTAKCLTCKLQISGDVEQSYYSADFNSDHQVLISSSGPGIPMYILYEWSYANNQVTLKEILAWETNEHLRNKLQKAALPTLEIHTISIGSGFTAKVLLQLPPNLDRSGNTKYPMLVDVYSGPDSFSVVNKWTMDWGTYLSSNQSVIYAKIDGRGSGLRGDKLLHAIYLKLGTVEISDQIVVAKELQQKFNFIDEDHTGIWGWSYGGYAAAMALANDDSLVFRCAASIAPVTDWAYYDSIYTERYMQLPTQNELGYANARLSTRAQKLRGKKFLLVHGTLDDNVHYQQTMVLAKNLERNDILFKQISYPDEDHGLAGVRPHLYHSLDRFFGECFGSERMMRSRGR